MPEIDRRRVLIGGSALGALAAVELATAAPGWSGVSSRRRNRATPARSTAKPIAARAWSVAAARASAARKNAARPRKAK